VAGGVADQAPFGIDDGPVYAVAFSPDGAIVASAGAEGDVLLRDARTAADLGELVSDNGAVWSMA
jgi:WD40 repeat protein